MAEVTQVDKKIRMDQWDIVKFQIMIHCYVKRIKISDHDLSCLSLLGILGEQTLEEFCQTAVENEIFSSTQSSRNALAKMEKKGLVSKQGKNRKRIRINPVLKIQTQGNILLDLKILYAEVKAQVLEPQEV